MQEQRYRCHEFQCLLDCFVRYRNRCLWCCDRCSSYQLSLYTSDVNLQVSLLRCIGHSVDGFKQISSVDCSGIKGANFQCLLDCIIRYRNKCFWCCDRCSRSQYRYADIQEIITIVGTIFSQVLM
ncbi:uncharacterized protein [Dysidea avara]|uniref:uncharacterized protein isoform X1 n=1 Tax=Dysidea avara TaxID=196820 RepID=UPI0033287EAE